MSFFYRMRFHINIRYIYCIASVSTSTKKFRTSHCPWLFSDIAGVIPAQSLERERSHVLKQLETLYQYELIRLETTRRSAFNVETIGHIVSWCRRGSAHAPQGVYQQKHGQVRSNDSDNCQRTNEQKAWHQSWDQTRWI